MSLPVIGFDVNDAGLGDLVCMAWLAEGYRHDNIGTPVFDPSGMTVPRRDLLGMLGQRISDCGSCSGIAISMYHHEMHTSRGDRPRLQVWSELLPGNPRPIRPSIHTNEQFTQGRDFVRKKKDRKTVVLFPSANFSVRAWPSAYWLDLATLLSSAGVRVIALDTDDRVISRMDGTVEVAWGHPIQWLGGVILESDFVVTNDSGPAHLAATLKVGRSAAIMGPTRNVVLSMGAEEWASERACTGCYFQRERGFRPACDMMCRSMAEFTPEEAARRVLARLAAQS